MVWGMGNVFILILAELTIKYFCFVFVFVFVLQKVLHKICSPHGKVLRIVIFHKNGLQALVEYPFQASLL